MKTEWRGVGRDRDAVLSNIGTGRYNDVGKVAAFSRVSTPLSTTTVTATGAEIGPDGCDLPGDGWADTVNFSRIDSPGSVDLELIDEL